MMKTFCRSYLVCGLFVAVGCGGSRATEAPPTLAPEPVSNAAEPANAAATVSTPGTNAHADDSQASAASRPRMVQVDLEAKSGSTLSGSAQLTENADGVTVAIELTRATPGLLATHIHEKGDCSAPDASSAGTHFNPDHHPHARPPQEPRHLGDLGNITVLQNGTGRLEVFVKGANLRAGDPRSFRDRALIVHEKKDDGGQPTGNAGGRIGCAVIQAP